jgi:hypothetical protein
LPLVPCTGLLRVGRRLGAVDEFLHEERLRIRSRRSSGEMPTGPYAVQRVEASVKFRLLFLRERQGIGLAVQTLPQLLEEFESLVPGQLPKVKCRLCHDESIARPN